MPHDSNLTLSPIDQCFHWLVRKRVAISAVVFTSIIASSVLRGAKPRQFAQGHDFTTLVAMAALLIGLSTRSWAAGTLVKNKVLTTTGPYRLVRNPLYAGSFLMMVGVCGLLDKPLYPFAMVAVILAIYALTIRSEERGLSKRFGAAWNDYAGRTPRYMPRSIRIDFSDWRLSQWVKNREVAPVLATLFALAAIELWEHLR